MTQTGSGLPSLSPCPSLSLCPLTFGLRRQVPEKAEPQHTESRNVNSPRAFAKTAHREIYISNPALPLPLVGDTYGLPARKIAEPGAPDALALTQAPKSKGGACLSFGKKRASDVQDAVMHAHPPKQQRPGDGKWKCSRRKKGGVQRERAQGSHSLRRELAMQTYPLARMIQTLSGVECFEQGEATTSQYAWIVHLESVCSSCGASRSTGEWDEMWGTCAPCGRKLDCGSENSQLPPECRECFCGSCDTARDEREVSAIWTAVGPVVVIDTRLGWSAEDIATVGGEDGCPF